MYITNTKIQRKKSDRTHHQKHANLPWHEAKFQHLSKFSNGLRKGKAYQTSNSGVIRTYLFEIRSGQHKSWFPIGKHLYKKCKTSLSIKFMTTWGHKLGAFSLKHQAPGFGHCHAVLAKTSYPVHFPKDPHAGHLFEQLSSQMWLLMLAEKHVMCRSAVGCESDVKHRETMQLQD
jgi:hypothetical protein